ncbi:MAG: type II secretion system protein GspG [Luteolibacter sp.]|uniref:type II secretion system protein GspG n=1 Tax=Luteolibacter sp. TaxID=1962973 RepID=UPI003267E26B
MEDDQNAVPSNDGRKSSFARKVVFGLIIFIGLNVVLGGLVWSLSTGCSSAPLSQVESDFKSFESALAMYRLNGRAYPSSEQGLKALVERPSTDPIPLRWVQLMPKIPNDPWGNPYTYRFPASSKLDEPEIISNGPDGIRGTPDDMGSQDE